MKKQAIYIRLTKVGSSSILALINQTPRLKKKIWTKRNDAQGEFFEMKHPRSALAIKDFLGEKEYNNSYTFATIRNPYERIVSIWKYLTGKGKHLRNGKEKIDLKRIKKYSNTSFKEFINLIKDHDLTHVDGGDIFKASKRIYSEHIWWHLTPLAPHVTDTSGNLIVDKLCRLEILKDEIDDVCKSINCPPVKYMKHYNKTNHTHYSTYYDIETRKIVEKLYGMDINLFKYKFEDE